MESSIDSVGIVGLGVLGTAILETLKLFNLSTKCYDKYKTINLGDNICSGINELINCNFIYLCLPTPYVEDNNGNGNGAYDKTELYNVVDELDTYNYSGLIIIKSTVEPGTTENILNKYHNLKIIHNPEFLTARTAADDFINQKHIVLGIPSTLVNKDYDIIVKFYETYFPDAKLSICNSKESECMKIACNSFYATKIQFLTEIKLLCDKLNIDYNNVKDLMLNNEWINPMHTNIPGPDGKLSFGGACFPKDTRALNSFMKTNNVHNQVINAVVEENKKMRDRNTCLWNI